MRRRLSRVILGGALLALALLFVAWFHDDGHRVAALAVFALPPLLLLAGVLRGNGKAAIWAGVFGLFWFSHGVMVAWSRAPERAFAGLEIVLALAIILASSWPGLRAAFGRRR